MNEIKRVKYPIVGLAEGTRRQQFEQTVFKTF